MMAMLTGRLYASPPHLGQQSALLPDLLPFLDHGLQVCLARLEVVDVDAAVVAPPVPLDGGGAEVEVGLAQLPVTVPPLGRRLVPAHPAPEERLQAHQALRLEG